MANRLHLTIGEVLSLLREEFPDVSISKIRFLESQGLVEPERTPSGYRKFYDHDVDRLRWILRQQREHFLPLKVIRGRLTGQEGDDPTGPNPLIAVESLVVVEEVVVEEVAVESEPGVESAAGEVAAGGALGEAPAMNGAETIGDTLPPGPGPADRPDQADRLFGPDDPPAGKIGAEAPVIEEPLAEELVAEATVLDEPVPDEPALDHPVPDEPVPDEPALDEPVLDEPVPDEPAIGDTVLGETVVGETVVGETAAEHRDDLEQAAETAGSGPSEPSRPHEPSAPESAVQRGGVGTPDIYSVAEIAEAVGCTPQLIRELQQFGILVAASDVGGKMYFEPDAVGLARVGARFAELGVEPRHLRTWRNAADREASLFEQLVMPLLRQRNPQSRRQAAERLDELSTLGSQLRAGLLAEAVRGIK